MCLKRVEPKAGSRWALCEIIEGWFADIFVFQWYICSADLFILGFCCRQSETEMLPATHSKELNLDLTVPLLPHFRIQRCVDTSFLWECRPLDLCPCRCPHFPTPQMFCLLWNTTTSSVSHKQRPSSKNHRFPNPSEGGLRRGFDRGVDADRLWIALVNLGVGCRWHWNFFFFFFGCFPWGGKLDERQMNFRSQTFEPSSYRLPVTDNYSQALTCIFSSLSSIIPSALV